MKVGPADRPSPSLRVKYFITGVLLPLLCLATASADPGAAISTSPWQSGRLSDHAALLLRQPALGIFIPLIACSMTCLTLWVMWPASSRWTLVRIGVYGGVLLSLQFLTFILMTSFMITFLAAVLVVPALALIVEGVRLTAIRARRFTVLHLLILSTVCGVATVLIQQLDIDVEFAFFNIFILALAAAPTLNAVTYIRAAIAVLLQSRRREPRRRWPMAVGGIAWLAAWIGSWRIAVDVMLTEYAKLPTGNPNCFVSSAAAHGHRWLVRADTAADGPVVSMQMRRLKLLELALAAASPRLHRLARRSYNRLGPPLARVCRRTAWLADAAYAALKPVEWLAECVRLAAKIPTSRLLGLYGGRQQVMQGDRPSSAAELSDALVKVAVDEQFTEAVLTLEDDSRLCFCHRVGERWAKAVGPERREDEGGRAAELLAAIAMFRLNAKHLDIQFQDGSRWDRALPL